MKLTPQEIAELSTITNKLELLACRASQLNRELAKNDEQQQEQMKKRDRLHRKLGRIEGTR